MRIIGSPTSPFVRFVRTILQELNLDYTLENSGFFMTATNEQRALVNQNNPVMRIPILIDQDQTVWDSRIMAGYLLNTYGQDAQLSAPQTIDEENLLTALYGTIDSGIAYFLAIKEGRDPSEGYTQRSFTRIQNCLAYLDQQEDFGAVFNLPVILLVCALEWLDKRDIFDWHNFSHLCEIHVQYKDRASLVATRIPDNA